VAAAVVLVLVLAAQALVRRLRAAAAGRAAPAETGRQPEAAGMRSSAG